jgi:ABC-type Zn uptake system ZnuABC Zn-binding protein ZnuA
MTVRVRNKRGLVGAQPKVYQPTKSEMAAIRRGRAALARGESVSLADFLKSAAANSGNPSIFAGRS